MQFKFSMSLQDPNGAFRVNVWKGLLGDKVKWQKEY